MSVQSSLDHIDQTLINHNKSDNSKMTIIRKYINEIGNDNIGSSIEKMGEASIMLAASDCSEDIFAGILVILSSVAMFIPEGGPIVSALLYVASSFISAFCERKQNIGNVVQNTISSALEKFEDSELKAKAHGTVNAFRISLAFMEGMKTVEEDEVKILVASVPIFSGVEFLGILKFKVDHLSGSKYVNEVLRAIEYTNTYVELAILRNSVVFQLYSKIKQSGHSPAIAEGIYNVLEKEKEIDKTFLEFLSKRDYSRKLFFACLCPSTMPKVLGYLNHFGLKFSLSDISDPFFYRFQLGNLEHWFGMRRRLFREAIMRFMNNEEGQGDNELNFYFEPISLEDSLFYIRSYEKPYVYMYMENSTVGQCYACNSKPGPSGMWKIIQYEEESYILSTKDRPNWFLSGGKDIYTIFHSDKLCPIELRGQENEPSHFMLQAFDLD